MTTGEGATPAGPGNGQATTVDRWGFNEGIFPLGQPVEPSPVEAAAIERIIRATRQAALRPWRDQAAWRGAFEADPDRGFEAWPAIRTRPSPEVSGALRDRKSSPPLPLRLVTLGPKLSTMLVCDGQRLRP